MADETGKISSEEARRCNERFEGYEKSLGRDLPCEICGGIVWNLNGRVLSLFSDSPSGVFGATQKTPLLNYICVNCGNMKFFAAKMWDVVVPLKSEVAKDGD